MDAPLPGAPAPRPRPPGVRGPYVLAWLAVVIAVIAALAFGGRAYVRRGNALPRALTPVTFPSAPPAH